MIGPIFPWSRGGGGFQNPMTALGDLIAGAAAGVPARLGIGALGQALIAATTSLAGSLAALLDGATGYVETPFPLISGPFSLAVWFNCNGGGTGDVFSNGHVIGGGDGGLELQQQGAQIVAQLGTNGVSGTCTQAGLSQGTWYLAIVTWDGTTLTLKTSTILGPVGTQTAPCSGTVTPPAGRQNLGHNQSNSISYFSGDLAEAVVLLGSAWSAAKVTALQAATTQAGWNAAVAALGGVTAWYHLAETVGTSATDSSGNGYTGTYTGGFTLDQLGPFSVSLPGPAWGQPSLLPVGTVLGAPVNLPAAAATVMLSTGILPVGTYLVRFQGLITCPAIASVTGLELYLAGGTAAFTVLAGPSATSIPYAVASDDVPFTVEFLLKVTTAGTVSLTGYNNAAALAGTLQSSTQGTSAKAGCSGTQALRAA